MKKKLLKERFQQLAGIITEQMTYTGCSDPLATNYDPNANGNSPEFGPFICQYNYGCGNFEQWATQLHGLALLNESLNNIPFPHIVTGVNNQPYLTPNNSGPSPYMINPDQPWSESEINNNPSSPSGMIDYICDWVCGTTVDMNPGQYCPACYAGASGFNFEGNLSIQDEGLWMCTCCKNIADQIEGCTDPGALNYDEEAVVDDGSCEYPPTVEVCGDPLAENFYCDDEGSWPASYNDPQGSTMWSTAQCDGYITPESNLQDNLPNYVSEVTWYNEDLYIQYIIPQSYTINNGLCEYLDGCTDPEADNYNSDAYNDDGSCVYTVTCYICEDPPGPSMYGTPGELTSEDFTINYNPEPGDEYCPEGYEENSENLDCGGTHTPDDTLQFERITCYQCEYPSPPVAGQGGYVISQEFEVPIGQGCPEDEGWYNEEPDCSGDPFDPETEVEDKRYRCKIVKMYPDGSSVGECVESANGPFESLQECEDAGCGEKVKKKKRCYKCKGLGPVGYTFDDPPGCPKGWEDEPPTDCGCKNPLVDQWLNNPVVIGTHCCDNYLKNPGFEDSFGPGPQCYNTWEQIGGDPDFDPHQCCSLSEKLQKIPSLRERLQKLANIKKKK